MTDTTTAEVLAAIAHERTRQHAKWGEQNHPDGTGPDEPVLLRTWMNIPGRDMKGIEDYGAKTIADAATKATNVAAHHSNVTFADILLEEVFEALAEADSRELRTELVQVAAVAAQWVEAIDRRNNNTEEA